MNRRMELASLAILLAAISAAAAWGMATPSKASGTAQGSLNVAAVVANACTVTNASLNFGTVDPVNGAALSANANILVQCSMGTNYTVSLDSGLNATGSQRRMKGALSSGYLGYALYSDAAGAHPFGSGSGQTVSAVGLGVSANPIPVYGSIPAGQSAPADSYGDTVAISVAY